MGTTINQTDLSPCLLMQERSIKYFGQLAADSNKPFTGLLDALKSPINKIAMQLTDDVNNGQVAPTGTNKRQVQIRYIKPTCADEVDVEVSECNDPIRNANALGFAKFEIDDFVSFGFSLTDDQFNEMCAGRDEIYMENFQTKYYNALKRLDKKLLNLILGYMGNYPNGTSSATAPIEIPLIKGDKTPNIGAFAEILKLYRIMGYSASPIWVGDNDLEILNIMKQFLSVGNDGIDMSKLMMDRFFYDGQVNATLGGGTEKIVATFAPGTFQLVEYLDSDRKTIADYKDVYINNIRTVRYKEQKVTMALPDGNWEFYYKYDCGQHIYNLQKRFGLFAMPEDAVCVNKYPALLFKVGCGEVDCTTDFF